MTKDAAIAENANSDVSILAAAASLRGESGRRASLGLVRQLGKYTLRRSIGRGGFGEVFIAIDDTTWNLVAVKTLSAHRREDAAARARFELEIRIGTELRHPNILPVIDHALGDVPHFATPLIDGPNLLRLLAKRPMPVPDAVALLRPVAEAVHLAHTHGYLHRDLKPANIVVEKKTGKPYVADFGLAKALHGEGGVTESLAVLGTQPYMPPEQLDPHLGDVSPATDVYGLGATLYHMLTGRPPFPRPDRGNRDLATQITWDTPIPPSKLNMQVPAELDRLCLLCLQKSPHDRYVSAAELAADLRRFEEGRAIEARLPGAAKRIYRRCRRQPVVAVLVAGLLGLSFTGGIAAVRYATEAAKSATDLAGAKAQTVAAQTEEAAARESERAQAYVSDMRDARLCGENSQVTELRSILSKYGTPDRQDLRNVEWYYWNRRCGGDARTVTLDFEASALALSNDGKKAAVMGNGQVAVFDTLTGARLFRSSIAGADEAKRKPPAPARGGGIRLGNPEPMPPDGEAVAFGPSGDHLAVIRRFGSDKASLGQLQVWELRTGTSTMSISDPRIGFGVAFSPDGQSVVAAGLGRTAWKAWDIASGHAQGVGRFSAVNRDRDDNDDSYVGGGLCFIDDRTLVRTSATRTYVWTWAAARDAEAMAGTDHVVVGRPVAHEGAAAVVTAPMPNTAVGPANKQSEPWTVTLHDLTDKTRSAVPTGLKLLTTPHTFKVMDIAPGVLAAQCEDSVLRVWSLDSHLRAGAVPQELRGSPSSCVAVAARRNVAAAIGDRTLCIWSTLPLPLERSGATVDPDLLRVFGVMSPSGKLITNPRFSRKNPTTVDVVATADKNLVASIPLGIGTPRTSAFSPDDRYLYLSILNQTLLPASRKDLKRPARDEIWELVGPRLIVSLPASAKHDSNSQAEDEAAKREPIPMANGVNTVSSAVAFHCERGVAFVLVNNSLARIELSSGAQELIDLPFEANSIAISPQGGHLAITGRKCGLYSLVDRKWRWINATTSTRSVFHKAEKYLVVQALGDDAPPVVLGIDSGVPWPALFKPQDKARYVVSTDGKRVFELSAKGLSVYTIDENPGTLVLRDSEIRLPESAKLDAAYLRKLEQQLIDSPGGSP